MTKIDSQFLSMLVCPATRQPLRPATEAEVAGANEAIGQGQLHNRGGSLVDTPLDAALATTDGDWLYPIRDDIPILLAAEALPQSSPADPA